MKIAFVRGQYLNNFELQSYYPLLKNKDFELTGFTSLRPLHQVNIPIKQFPSPVDLPNFPYKFPILNRLFIEAMYLWGLEKKLTGYDMAHARETYFHFTYQVIKAKLKGYVKKVLVTCSETIPFNHETIRGRKELKQFVIKNADYFHCLTEKARDCLIQEGVSPSKISVIPYGIDLNNFKPNSVLKKSKLTIIFIGRLEEQKGIYELLESWDKLKKSCSNVELKIIGKGPLESLIKQNNLTSESCPYSQIPKILSKADILVLPSKPTKYWEEYFGMVLIEALACGVPIVTTNCGAIPEIVGQSALIVPYGNSHKLSQEIKKLIENPRLRATLKASGIKQARIRFDCDKQALKLGKLYQQVVK